MSDVQLIDFSDQKILDSGWNKCNLDYEKLVVPYTDRYNVSCKDHKVCNWNTTCGPSAACCKTTETQCVLCHDPLSCVVPFPSIANAATCAAASVCIPPEPRPDYFSFKYLNVTSPGCTQKCSHYCFQPVCSGSFACKSMNLLDCQSCAAGRNASCPASNCTFSFYHECTKTECETYFFIISRLNIY
jgi:hypothetical protein